MIAVAAAAGALSFWGAANEGANMCYSHLFDLPGERIDATYSVYRAAPRRFVGHCDMQDELGNKLHVQFSIIKYQRSSGRWQVLGREK